MTELKQETEVLLTSKLKYHSGGEAVQATSVLLIAASSKQLKHAIVLKQTFFKAIASMKSEGDAPAPTEIDMTGEDVMSMLYMADVDVEKMMNSSRELFKSGVAKLDGVVDFTDSLLDQLSVDDFEKLVGEYLINFTLASALKKMKSSK